MGLLSLQRFTPDNWRASTTLIHWSAQSLASPKTSVSSEPVAASPRGRRSPKSPRSAKGLPPREGPASKLFQRQHGTQRSTIYRGFYFWERPFSGSPKTGGVEAPYFCRHNQTNVGLWLTHLRNMIQAKTCFFLGLLCLGLVRLIMVAVAGERSIPCGCHSPCK